MWLIHYLLKPSYYTYSKFKSVNFTPKVRNSIGISNLSNSLAHWKMSSWELIHLSKEKKERNEIKAITKKRKESILDKTSRKKNRSTYEGRLAVLERDSKSIVFNFNVTLFAYNNQKVIRFF